MTDGAVVGLGSDLVSVNRFELAMGRHGERLLARIFTTGEVRYAQSRRRPAESLAARFAAKEACFKAVGAGWPDQGIHYQDVEVVKAASGAPGLLLHGRIAELARTRGAGRCAITLSHTEDHALAVVLLLTRREEGSWTG